MTATALLRPGGPLRPGTDEEMSQTQRREGPIPCPGPGGEFKLNGSKKSIHRLSAKDHRCPECVTVWPGSVTVTAGGGRARGGKQ